MKFWPVNWKCWSAWSEFRLFTSFRWFLSLKLKAVSDLPAYCLLHNTHSITYIKYLLLQLSLLCILKVLYVTVLLKEFVDSTCVQHRSFNLKLQSFEWPFWLIFWRSCFRLLMIDFFDKNILQVSVLSEGYYGKFCKNLFKISVYF